MLLFLLRGFAASVVARRVVVTIAKSLVGAAASGVGWKAGSDAYDAFKRWYMDVDPEGEDDADYDYDIDDRLDGE